MPALPGVVIEVRADGAFFSDAIVSGLKRLGVEFTLSVPFLRSTTARIEESAK